MTYNWTRQVYLSMARNPKGTETGTIELPVRPLEGEEVEIEGEYVVIKKIRHNPQGVTLVLADKTESR